MTFKTIKKKSTLEIVIQQIKLEIKNGNLKSGERLPSERELSDQLGVSRTSIREAVKALSFAGYLKVIQGKGTYILDTANKYNDVVDLFSKLSNYSLDCLMETRIMLESEFARIAALNANEDEISLIENIFKEIVNSKDINSFFVKDLEFHLTIADATHNPIMSGLMKIITEMLYKETQKIISISKYTRKNTIEITRKLVRAIKQRNALEAKKLMADHIRDIKTSLK
jgi:GntR family transcriptional regulator, transcriptional repressor for pyruvate dehydrogenase complex